MFCHVHIAAKEISLQGHKVVLYHSVIFFFTWLFPSLVSEIRGCIFHAGCMIFFSVYTTKTLYFIFTTVPLQFTHELTHFSNSLYYTAHFLLPCGLFTRSRDVSTVLLPPYRKTSSRQDACMRIRVRDIMYCICLQVCLFLM